MRTSTIARGTTTAILAAWLGLVAGPIVAENVDPDEDGSQYAYSENAGWLNAEPSGNGGPGVDVGEFELTGWMWGENLGWVSLSCQNTASCGTAQYGVTNDGGVLSGHAWAENAGWISFSCETTASCDTADYGVTIDHQTGEFDGQAWAENLGWIHFASSGVHPFRMKTAWTCSVPTGVPQLVLSKLGADVQLDWTLPPGATASDLIRGDLSTLRSTAGDYALATLECVADNELGTTWLRPAVGADEWLLVRSADCGGGSYDTAGAGQLGTRNGGIEASGLTCP